jgi:hypothetical protein
MDFRFYLIDLKKWFKIKLTGLCVNKKSSKSDYFRKYFSLNIKIFYLLHPSC